MNVSAFIRSYSGDFKWLEYCLLALRKYEADFQELVVAVPSCDYDSARGTIGRFALIQPWQPQHPNGYIDQQICKMSADTMCRGDFIMHFDSDCILTRDFKLSEFFTAGMPKLLFRSWQDAGGGACWRYPTRQALGVDPQFETMPSHPFVYHRSTHELLRNHIAGVHGSFLGYMSSVPVFSEFNALGNFAHQFTPDAYHFVRAGRGEDCFPRPFKQFWSRGEFPERELEEMTR